MSQDSWYYIAKNTCNGPFSEDDMRILFSEGKITEDTPVWGGYGDKWIPLKYYGLNKEDDGEKICIVKEKHPEKVNNLPLWGFHLSIAISVTIFVLCPLDAYKLAFCSYFILNILVLAYDSSQLKKAGFRIKKEKSAVTFPPIYIWRRNKALDRPPLIPVLLWMMFALFPLLKLTGILDDIPQ